MKTLFSLCTIFLLSLSIIQASESRVSAIKNQIAEIDKQIKALETEKKTLSAELSKLQGKETKKQKTFTMRTISTIQNEFTKHKEKDTRVQFAAWKKKTLDALMGNRLSGRSEIRGVFEVKSRKAKKSLGAYYIIGKVEKFKAFTLLIYTNDTNAQNLVKGKTLQFSGTISYSNIDSVGQVSIYIVQDKVR